MKNDRYVEEKPSNYNMIFCLEEMINLLEVNDTWYVDNLNAFVNAMFDADPKVKDGFYNFVHRIIQIKKARIENHREALNQINDLRFELGTLEREMEGGAK